MEKPFSTLPIWAVILIAFSIALAAGLFLKHFVRFNVVMRDGNCGVLVPSVWSPLHRSDCDKHVKELAKLDGTAKKPETEATK